MARFIRVDLDIFQDAVCGEKSDHGARFEHFLAYDLLQQLLPIVEQVFRFGADSFLLQYFRINTAQFPGMEKRRPVNVGNDLTEWHWIVNTRPQE